ncbi:hypothetical protein NF212_24545 [Parasalinivibrio latis]|uniref:hypothetical protein n=1 Tax=Parasalinivibrio latis TaxID=2952610 RepID=UPI0030E49E26
MKQAIEFRCQQYDQLVTTARKRSISHQFIFVQSGMVLVRLGRSEFPVLANQGFWLSFDCLYSLTILPGSRVCQTEVSVRVQDHLPEHTGYVELSPFVIALVQELAIQQQAGNFKQRTDSRWSNLVKVLCDYAREFKPDLETKLTESLRSITSAVSTITSNGQLSPKEESALNSTGFQTAEVRTALQVREWIKSLKSGGNSKKLANEAGLPEPLFKSLLESVGGYNLENKHQ